MKKIYWVGDSTVQTNDITTYPQTGIGQVFSLFLREDVCVVNHAKNGRSTKSFLDEERFLPVKENMQEGDFLFIQFGHNDEKKEDPLRYTDPRSTFRENLRFFIRSAREKGAVPVLITPLERRCFEEDGSLGEGAHGAYADAVRQTAEQEKTALIDLHSMSRNALRCAGEKKSRDWYMNLEPGCYTSCPEGKTDNTHLKQEGAVLFAAMIAGSMKKLGGIYGEVLLPEIPECPLCLPDSAE